MAAPTFICIGLQRAGTRWLYEQLKFHPDCWMPPVKELHFFDRPFPRQPVVRGLVADDYPNSSPFIEFLRQLATQPTFRDFGVYEALFDFAGGRITGDITPQYGALSEEVIASIAERYGDLKVLLLLRNPVARVWSAANNALRRGRGGVTQEVLTLPGIRSFLADNRVTPLCFPTEIYDRWYRGFSSERFRYFFLDDIMASPEATRADTLSFLGADPGQKSGELSADYNSKRKGTLPIPTEIAQYLTEYFGRELLRCAEVFGGPAKSWVHAQGVEAA